MTGEAPHDHVELVDLVTFTDRAAELHGRAVPDDLARPLAWRLEATAPALVLGSRQSDDVLDLAACADAGVDVVHRRSGGGVVLVEPGAMTWVDVLVPPHDRRWTDDVVAAMWWCGERWAAALDAIGVDGVAVTRAATSPHALSELVCFAGTAHGEVTVEGVKLVGISQRRTRRAARFQCCVHHRWNPELLADLLAEPGHAVAVRALAVAELDVELRPALVDALVDALAA